MKKRLLITSIVMMLVVAVALSTATYAWFTSNTTVSASTMTLKAATSDKSALAIGWSGETAGTYISSAISQVLDPMAPNILNWDETANNNAGGYVQGALTNGLTTYELASGNQQFYTSDIKQEGSKIVFSNTGDKVNPVVFTEVPGDAVKDTMTSVNDKNSFYIINMSTANVLDKVVVSGVFTETDNATFRYVMVDTSRAPLTSEQRTQQGVQYFTRDGANNYTELTTAEYNTLDQYGFDNQVTYYTKDSLYVLTDDEIASEDTYYYLKNSSGTYDRDTSIRTGDSVKYANSNVTSGTFAALKDELYTESAGTYTKVASDATFSSETTYYQKYYELRNTYGDDMLRIAIFTTEYRYTDDDTVEAEKTYYKINKATGVLSSFLGSVLTSNGVTSPKADKYLEIPNNYIVGGENRHVLLGVLGQEETKYKLASSYDMNEVYFTATYEQVAIAESDFAAAVAKGIYTKNDNVYTLVSGSESWSDSKTYYQPAAFTQATINSFAQGTNYYTAANTVANGPIAINGAVNAMHYYNNVTTTLDLALELQPGEFVDIIAVAWLDGKVLDDTRSDEYAQVSLKFDSVRDQHQSNPAHPVS